MDFNELKNLIQQEGGKIIVVENGKPVMVVLSFEDFKARNKKVEPENEEELTIDDLPL